MTEPLGSPAGESILGAALGAVLEELSERRAFVLLATPYLSLPAHLLAWRGDELHLRVALGGEGALKALSVQTFRLRVPWALGMVAGETRLLGFGQEQGRRILRIAAPPQLAPDERRSWLRVHPAQECRVTLNPDGQRLVPGRVEDLSLGGARVSLAENLADPLVGRSAFRLSLNLDRGPRMDLWVRAIHQDGPSLGVQFDPPPEGRARADLEAWLLPEADGARQRWENRAALLAEAASRMRPRARPEGALLVGRGGPLESALRAALGESVPLRRCAPALAPLLEALETPPRLAILHLSRGDLEERFLVKSLVEALPEGTARVLLGTPGAKGGQELATELKASYLDWSPGRAVFFRRLAEGLLRRAGEEGRPG
ncbi:MAG: PilZ domain-containing protein [Acidobacteria bacterium]|nr:PilZ domain-containing protein [Acidobacteriota bacterium]